MAPQGRDHEGFVEAQARVDGFGQAQQHRHVDGVDLVEDQEPGLADLGHASEDRLVFGIDPLAGVDQQRHHVGIARAAPGRRHHGPVEPALGREDARRVDEDDLRVARRSRCRAPAPAWSGPCATRSRPWCRPELLSRVDLPALGAPMSAVKPHLGCSGVIGQVSGCCARGGVSKPSRIMNALGGGLFGQPLRGAAALGGRKARHGNRDDELRRMSGPAARHFAVDRRWPAEPLGPFLQRGLGVAQCAKRRAHPLRPGLGHDRRCRRKSPVEEHRPDQALRRHRPESPAGRGPPIGSRRAQAEYRVRGPTAMPTSAQRSLRTRSARRRESSPSAARGIFGIEHGGHAEPQHPVAQKLQPLIAGAAPGLGLARRSCGSGPGTRDPRCGTRSRCPSPARTDP